MTGKRPDHLRSSQAEEARLRPSVDSWLINKSSHTFGMSCLSPNIAGR